MTLAIPDTHVLFLPRPGRLSAYVRSRLRPLDIDAGTVGDVLARYGLAPTAPSRNLPNARRNRNLIVQTGAGKKILKLYRDDWRPTTILYEHSILNELARQGAPAPRLCRTTNSRTFVNHYHQYYALFEFIPGQTYTASFLMRSHRLRLMDLSGRTLARLHRQLNGFQPEQQHHLGFKDYSHPRHRDMAWHARKIEELKAASERLAEPEAASLAARLIQQSDAILAELFRLSEQLNRAALPRLVIHGDYGLHNLLFRGSTQATPVDFELARLEWRLVDLVSCLSKLRYANGDYDLESINRFLDGYRREFHIADEEWQHFPQVWQFYRLMGVVQYWTSYFETNGPVRKLHSALDSFTQANWAVDNPATILALNTDWRGSGDAHHVP